MKTKNILLKVLAVGGLLSLFPSPTKTLAAEGEQQQGLTAEDNLVARYQFKNAANLGEDTSGNDNHLTLYGNGVSKGTKGVHFAGDGSMLSASATKVGDVYQDFSDSITGDFTITFSGVSEDNTKVAYPISTGFDTAGMIVYSCPDGNGCYYIDGPVTTRTFALQTQDTWSNIAIVGDATNKVLYVYKDGALVNQQAMKDGASLSNGTGYASVFSLGGRRIASFWGEGTDWCDTADNAFKGSLDDVRVYNKALSATEVSNINAGDDNNQEPEFDSAEDLIAHYTFDDTTNLGKDSSGNNNDLLIHGTGVVAGIDGVRLTGDGSMLYAKYAEETTNDFSDSITGSYTVSMWLNRSSDDNMFVCQSAEWESALSIAYAYETYYTKTGSGQDTMQGTGIAKNKWYHVALVADEDTDKQYLYVNGSLITSTDKKGEAFTMAYAGKVFTLGGQSSPVDNWFANAFNGSFDDVRVYSKALTASNIAAVINEADVEVLEETNNILIPPYEPDDSNVNLVAHYEFNDVNNLLKDSAGNYDLKYVQSPTGTITMDGEAGAVFSCNTALIPEYDFSDSVNGDYTVSLWVKCDNSGNPGYILATGCYENTFNIGTAYGSLYLAFGPGCGSKPVVCTLTNNDYTNIILTVSKEQGLARVFINGQKSVDFDIEATKLGLANDGWSFTIGSQADENGSSVAENALFTGCIKDLRVYNGMVSTTTATAIYNQSAVSYVAKPTIVTGEVNMSVGKTNSIDDIKTALGNKLTVKVGEENYEVDVEWLEAETGKLYASICNSTNKSLLGLVCEATYEYQQYTNATFETNGGSEVEAISVETGSALEELPTTTREGYSFEGWYANEQLTIPYDINTKINEEITIYAKWFDLSSKGSLVAHYEFKDANNVGKDSLGNYDLSYVAASEATLVAGDGEVIFNHNTSLYAKEDFSDYLTDYTISLWVKCDNSGNPGYILATGCYENTFNIGTAFGNLYIAFGPGCGAKPLACTLTNDAYTNIIITASRELGEARVYINGAFAAKYYVEAEKIGLGNDTFAFVLGSQADENGLSVDGLFTGSMKDVRVYNGMLQEAEIANIYSQAAEEVKPITIKNESVNTVIDSTNTISTIQSNLGTTLTVVENNVEYQANIEWLQNNYGTLKAVIVSCSNKSLIGKVAKLSCKYKASINVEGNATIKVNNLEDYSNLQVSYGDEITIEVTASNGYICDGVVVGREEVTLTNNQVTFDFNGLDIYVYVNAINYDVTLEANGGVVEATTLQYNIENELVLPTPATRTGYEFRGWFTTAEFTGESVIKIAVGETGNKQFFAKWLKVVNVSYELNGGENATTNPKTYSVEDGEVQLANPTKVGYEFKGWFATAELTGEAITTLKNVAEDIKLYAKYDAIMLKVTFVTNGGAAIEEVTVQYGKTITIPTEPIKEGFSFDGWYTDEACTTEFAAFNAIYENTTIYAKWNANEVIEEVKKGCNGAAIPSVLGLLTLAGVLLVSKKRR